MKVSGSQVASVRAYVRGNTQEFDRLTDSFGLEESRANGMLISACFYRAASERFSGQDPRSDIIDFVSSVRAVSDELATEVEPIIAERILLFTVEDHDIDDIDETVRNEHLVVLLAALMNDADLSDAELDEFLDESRRLADSWLQPNS